MSGIRANASLAIGAQNTFTAWARVRGEFNVSISGTFVATVWLQKSYDGGSTALDVQSYTAPVEDLGVEPEDEVVWRLGVKTGGYTSGTANCRVSQ